jgi:hypothetical protein
VEVLVAAMIIAATAVPATDALRGAMYAADADSAATVNHFRLVGKLEEVLAKPHAILSAQALGPATATTYSDTAGSSDRRLVFISAYDGDNADADNDPFTGTDSGLLWIRVQIEGTAMAVQSLQTDR